MTTTEKKPCGCSGKSAKKTNGGSTKSCGCGCSGCSECAAPAPKSACTSGTREATPFRNGPSADNCTAPRPRFFRGELVTDLDLTAVVDYHRSQQLLSNDVIGGWGVYCGYELSLDSEKCAVKVGPGVAYDARGRALVNGKTVCLGRPAVGDLTRPSDACNPSSPPPTTTLWLAVAYDDCLDAAKPRYSTPCGTSSDPGCDFTRIRERPRFVWLTEQPPEDYWTSGCLSDPCAKDPVTDEDPRCTRAGVDLEALEPLLDICTPEVGIRGGAGLSVYAHALLQRWNLRRNFDRLRTESDADVKCPTGPGSIIDVISGVACEPCPGETFVLLARVTWESDECGASAITLKPFRRRVLSNADLTFLVMWLIERQICELGQPHYVSEEELPESNVSCASAELPKVEKTLKRIAEVIAGDVEEREAKKFRGAVLEKYTYDPSSRSVESLWREQSMIEIYRSVRGGIDPEEQRALLERRRYALTAGSRKRHVVREMSALLGRPIEDAKRDKVEAELDRWLAKNEVETVAAARWERRVELIDKLEALKVELRPEVAERLAERDEDEVQAEHMAKMHKWISQHPEGQQFLDSMPPPPKKARARTKKAREAERLEVPPVADEAQDAQGDPSKKKPS